ncbi:MAG: NAD(P)/FAD-dependent oxidoreductase [Clostridia bacterium]
MKICVIGGGASGMVAAIFCARRGAEVLLLEKNDKLGKKMFITGKGRCNLTNACEPDEFLGNVVSGEKFLRSAIYGFTPDDAIAFFEGLGLTVVTERGNRVFPFSQKSSDVIRALEDELWRLNVEIRLKTAVREIRKNASGGFDVLTPWDKFTSDKVIVATGGVTYPSTGSTGDGYEFAKKFGHSIVEPAPALAPIILKENVSSMQGISLKNVELSAYGDGDKLLCREFGEMLFTSKGISGPIALTVSSHIVRSHKVRLSLDLKPALDDTMLDNRIVRDFEARSREDLKNVTRALLPEKLNTYVLSAAKVLQDKKVNTVTKEERARLVKFVKNLPFNVKELAPFEEAVITAGGVDLKELKPSMESKMADGLYFVGETIDVDALTGGFNLQIAYSTAVKAAENAVKLTENEAK